MHRFVALSLLAALPAFAQPKPAQLIPAQSEIAFTTKEAAWSAVKRLDGLPLAQELTTLDLPPVLRDALLERAAATTAW